MLSVLVGTTIWQWAAFVGYELLLFAGFFFLLGSLDDIAVDIHYLWLRMTGRGRAASVDREALNGASLAGPVAVMIPAWSESGVIGGTISHLLAAWPQAELRLYVGCYRNDPQTAQAVIAGSNGDPRLRLVVHDRGIM